METETKCVRGLSRRQTKAIEAFLNDQRKSKAQAIREAGYGKSIARKPHKVFNSPSVIAELEKRGYDSLGIRVEPQARLIREPVLSVPKPQFDVSRIPMESLQDLKERLAAITVTREETGKPYVPTGNAVDIFNAVPAEKNEPEEASLSSM